MRDVVANHRSDESRIMCDSSSNGVPPNELFPSFEDTAFVAEGREKFFQLD